MTTNEEDYYDDEYWQHDCHRCDSTGMILVCPDDMCRGLGYCIHGDGEIVCPVCKGESVF